VNLHNLDQAPSANDYLKTLQQDESSREFQPVGAGVLRLTTGGLLQVGDKAYELMDQARLDLAKLARIPGSYFEQIDPELRAANFNARLGLFVGRDEALEVTSSNDKSVHRVQRPR
jgi:hypothetical protein